MKNNIKKKLIFNKNDQRVCVKKTIRRSNAIVLSNKKKLNSINKTKR